MIRALWSVVIIHPDNTRELIEAHDWQAVEMIKAIVHRTEEQRLSKLALAGVRCAPRTTAVEVRR